MKKLIDFFKKLCGIKVAEDESRKEDPLKFNGVYTPLFDAMGGAKDKVCMPRYKIEPPTIHRLGVNVPHHVPSSKKANITHDVRINKRGYPVSSRVTTHHSHDGDSSLLAGALLAHELIDNDFSSNYDPGCSPDSYSGGYDSGCSYDSGGYDSGGSFD